MLEMWKHSSVFFPLSNPPFFLPHEYKLIIINNLFNSATSGGDVGRSSGLMVSVPIPDREVQFRALAGVIVLCSWARHFTLAVPLSTQEYKWVPANCQGNLTKLLGGYL